LSLLADLRRGAATLGWTKFYSGAASFRKTYRNGLLRRARTVLTFPDVVHFFADEFAGLRRGRFPLLFVALRAFQCFFFRHVAPN
jgi:hypothetical protein